jgi:Protein of unknown function (DUF3485)
MAPASKYLPLAAVAVLALGLGFGYGLETDRWRPSRQLEQSLARLEAVPKEVGDWKGTDLPFQAEDFARAGIRGTVFRRYENTRTGAGISVLVVCGRGGPISVHTPDICYAGAGYEAIGKPEKRPVVTDPTRDAIEFWALRFTKTDAVVPTQLEVYWAWCRGSGFEAPDQPRFAFARTPALCKMYVVREFAPNSRAARNNACEEFLRRALPEFQAALAWTD